MSIPNLSGRGVKSLWLRRVQTSSNRYRIEQAGFKITMSDDPNLATRRKALGVPESLAGCHLAQVR
jgi:hypothetical protein